MFVRRVRIFIRQSKSDEHARHFKCVMHLRHKWNRSALANKNRALSKSLFQSFVRYFKKWMREWSDPWFAGAVHGKFASHSLGQQFPNVFLDLLGDFFRRLIRHQSAG